MDNEIILSYLEELAEQLGISVWDESINLEETFSAGGLCRVEGKYILILNSKTTTKEKIEVSIKALQKFELSNIYVKPVIRELLEGEGGHYEGKNSSGAFRQSEKKRE